MFNKEDAYKGYLASKETQDRIRKEKHEKALNDYYKDPNICETCGNIIEVKQGKKIQSARRKKFCSRDCAYEKLRTRKKESCCLNCGGLLGKHSLKYCSSKCLQDKKYKDYIARWLEGLEAGTKFNGYFTSNHIRRWAVEKFGWECSVCRLTKWLDQPIPLTLDHIDGNYQNNRPENFRLICANCDRLSPHFTGKNRGRGRKFRKKYDAEISQLFSRSTSDG